MRIKSELSEKLPKWQFYLRLSGSRCRGRVKQCRKKANQPASPATPHTCVQRASETWCGRALIFSQISFPPALSLNLLKISTGRSETKNRAIIAAKKNASKISLPTRGSRASETWSDWTRHLRLPVRQMTGSVSLNPSRKRGSSKRAPYLPSNKPTLNIPLLSEVTAPGVITIISRFN